ncbi:hypothetical protein vBRpoSV10_218 [Ruegeria phage vB_RpoS-V10]|nr:hypothetical protein DSS3P8_213 [Roseobacter phage DSS3P8]AWY09340.1 hypothetical protein vBRpoSV10_218 [Ruegeria phage vB_RpoS-V10]
MSIAWLYMDEDQPDYDLVATHFGEYVDVIQHGMDSDVWRVTYGNVTVAENIVGRAVAKKWAEDNLTSEAAIMKLLLGRA